MERWYISRALTAVVHGNRRFGRFRRSPVRVLSRESGVVAERTHNSRSRVPVSRVSSNSPGILRTYILREELTRKTLESAA